jgi:hypothetical protein
LGLVDEEDGMLLLVAEENGLVRVVCPNAQPEINASTAAVKRNARMTVRPQRLP